MIPRQDLGVGECIVRYGGGPVYALAIVEFADGRVVGEPHYLAEPFAAPGSRARWVEKMDAR